MNAAIRVYNAIPFVSDIGEIGKIGKVDIGGRFEKGGAFENGELLNTPTLFGFGNGKTGMAGEAGTEAILPLSRNAQGELGVMGNGGGGVTVNISVNGNIIGDEAGFRDFAETIGNELKTLRGLEKVESLA